MTGCRCHDPVVFGHQGQCGRQLGPDSAGGHGRFPQVAPGHYGAMYSEPKRRTVNGDQLTAGIAHDARMRILNGRLWRR